MPGRNVGRWSVARAGADDGEDDRIKTLTEHGRAVLDALSSSPTDPDTVAAHAGLPVAAVQRSLLELELRGFVERDPSGFYYRV
ncbi:MAG: helix-turn-helix domain-containing protein [Candidatus Latescibacterota bacterium]|nr:MAG: helix-turn-helix domain-containing protein [Candidatus Latescibacterota bacterium]